MSSNPLKDRRKALGLTQEQVALQANTTKATIMKLERGYMQLTANWLERLAPPLQCHPADLLPQHHKAIIPLLGEVTLRGTATLYRKLPLAHAAQETSQEWAGLAQVEAPPETGYRHLFALRVADDGLEPFLREGSLIYAAEPMESGFDTLLGQLALCQTAPDHWVIRRITQGYSYGKYNLSTLNGSVAADETLLAAARIIFFKPV